MVLPRHALLRKWCRRWIDWRPLERLPRPCNKYALTYIVPPPIGLEFTVTALQLFKALADPTRLACVLTLQARGELCVCDLYARLEVSQPKMSRHLAQLRKAGLLSQRKKAFGSTTS